MYTYTKNVQMDKHWKKKILQGAAIHHYFTAAQCWETKTHLSVETNVARSEAYHNASPIRTARGAPVPFKD